MLGEDKRSFGKFPFSKPVGMKCRLCARNMNHELAHMSAHKISNNKARNEDEYITTWYMISLIREMSMGETHQFIGFCLQRLSQLIAHKISNNKARNEDEYITTWYMISLIREMSVGETHQFIGFCLQRLSQLI